MEFLRTTELLPTGFSAVDALSDGDSAVITMRARSVHSACPSCGAVSDRSIVDILPPGDSSFPTLTYPPPVQHPLHALDHDLITIGKG